MMISAMPPSSFLVSAGLFLGALLLASTTALTLVPRTLWARPAGGGRRLLAVACQALALLPITALLWAVIGLWAGLWARPVASLTPVPVGNGLMSWADRLAVDVWFWALPLWVLTLPLACRLTAVRLLGERSWHAAVTRTGWLALALLPLVEQAFLLPGAVAELVNPVEVSGSLLLQALPMAALALGWLVLCRAWPWQPEPWHYGTEERIREAALAIGLSPREVRIRHLRGRLWRRRLGAGLSWLAWGLSVWAAYGFLGRPDLGAAYSLALDAAITCPWTPLKAVLPVSLCALSLWVVGRIIAMRSR